MKMISKNILVDSALIGTIHFYAYVFNNYDGQIGFGLFTNDGPKPIVYFLRSKTSRTTLHFDDEIIFWLCDQSEFSTQERRHLFKEFLDFAIRMERKAAEMIFKDVKMTTLSDSREIIKYKRLYIHYQRPSISPTVRLSMEN